MRPLAPRSRHGRWPSCFPDRDIRCLPGDANRELVRLVSREPWLARDAGPARGVVFLDPYALPVEWSRNGRFLVLIPGLPEHVDLGRRLSFVPAAAIALAVSAALGALLYLVLAVIEFLARPAPADAPPADGAPPADDAPRADSAPPPEDVPVPRADVESMTSGARRRHRRSVPPPRRSDPAPSR